MDRQLEPLIPRSCCFEGFICGLHRYGKRFGVCPKLHRDIEVRMGVLVRSDMAKIRVRQQGRER